MGEKTFGKGSVQSVIGLDDGSAIRLTTAKYYTPDDRVIHDKGVMPDIVIPIPPEEWRQLAHIRSRPKHWTPGKGEMDDETIPDTQLEQAIDILKGILIFQAASRENHALAFNKE